jgi:hypothetical protein
MKKCVHFVSLTLKAIIDIVIQDKDPSVKITIINYLLCILYNQRDATYIMFFIISALHAFLLIAGKHDNTQGCTYSFISS